MSAGNFQHALDFIWGSQRDGHQNDSAPGEAFRTSWGITASTWNVAVSHGLVKGNVAKATKDQATIIYMAFYWNVMSCTLLPAGLDVLLFEQGCLGGTGTAAKVLQEQLGFTARNVDGVIGPKTCAAVAKHPVGLLIARQGSDFLDHLATLKNWPTFRRGWKTREGAAMALAHQLAGAA